MKTLEKDIPTAVRNRVGSRTAQWAGALLMPTLNKAEKAGQQDG